MISALHLSSFSHPFFVLFCCNAITALTLMHTLPCSLIRPGVWILITLGTCFSLPTYLGTVGRVPWTAFLAGHTILGVLQFLELALLRRWTFDKEGRDLLANNTLREKQQERHNASLYEKLYFGYFVALSNRHTGTPFEEAKSLPPFSSSDPNYIPSRKDFLIKRFVIAVLSYIALDLASMGNRSQHVRNATFRPPEHVSLLTRIGDVSWVELGFRFQYTVGYYAFCYCLIQCYTSILACVMVALQVDKVECWRPNFDVFEKSYSLRQFWG